MFKNIVQEIQEGYVAVVDKDSPLTEKQRVAKLSHNTRGTLGLGGFGGPNRPLITLDSWDDYEPHNPYYVPHRLHVFVLVQDNKLVGYVAIRWHRNVRQQDRLLDESGNPVESSSKVVTLFAGMQGRTETSNEPKRLQSWGVEGICIRRKWQRHGLGKLLLQTALAHLGTNEREVAYDPPLTHAGKALLKSMGLSLEQLRFTPGS